ncbi:MAG: hypothetical protein WC678_00570 [Parcubacteria group bacterium]|jgi:hypothetical protein
MDTINAPEITEEQGMSKVKKNLVLTCGIVVALLLCVGITILRSHIENNSSQEIETLEELNANSLWILKEKELIEKNGGDMCSMNRAITQFNKERWKFLSSPSFLEKELLPPEIKKFNARCEEVP